MSERRSGGGAPLFGLRWVPDSQLRPLRYLPNPQASPGGLADWWQPHTTPQHPGTSRTTTTAHEDDAEAPLESVASPLGDSEALKLRQEIRVDPFRQGFSHIESPNSIDLNAVKLCFQVNIMNR